MDALLEALAKLLGVFKDPAQVVLLLVAVAEGFALYKLVRVLLTSWEAAIVSREKMADALDGLNATIKESLKNGKYTG